MMAFFALAVLVCIVGSVGEFSLPKILRWVDRIAERRREEREFRAELERRRRAREAWRFGLAAHQRRGRPLTCACCGARFDALSQAVAHRCVPTEDTQ